MSSAGRLSPLVVFALVVVAVLLGSATEALAQVATEGLRAYHPPESTSRQPEVSQALWDVLTRPRTLIPLIVFTLGFIGGLINGDDDSWLKLFGLFVAALVVAIILFESGMRVAHTPGPLTAGLGTIGVLFGALLLLVLKYTRPLFFASTEAAFSLAVIYFSIRSLDGGGEKWATLLLGAYGVVDGIDRIKTEMGEVGKPAAKA